jgi:hypothetical protein
MIAARILSQSLFCGLMAVAGSDCGAYASMPVEGSFDRTLTVNGPVDLEIRSGSGGVRIDAGPVETVHVVARIRANPWFSSDVESRVRRIAANPPIEQNGNTILIGRNGDEELFRYVSIGYDVTVPETTHVHSVWVPAVSGFVMCADQSQPPPDPAASASRTRAASSKP